jgi:hypothetical protein
VKIPLIGIRLGLPVIAYLVVGAFVAQGHSYWKHTGTFDQVLSAVLGTVLWPLVLFGSHFRVS